tara:strand:- start:30 stop:695 length:666 start_codon:yes stop_codon:yes gene_type:complete
MEKYSTEDYESRTERRIRFQVENNLLREGQSVHVGTYFNQLEDIKSGNVLDKACRKCGVKKPVTEFHVDLTYKNTRRHDCKSCHKERQRPPQPQPRKKQTLCQFELCIRFGLQDNLGHRTLASSIELWAKLGYNKEDLARHIESQFEDWMNWENNGRMPRGGERKVTWQFDHKIPRGCFAYKSLDDKDFKDCWSLENLRPLDSVDNAVLGHEFKRMKKDRL